MPHSSLLIFLKVSFSQEIGDFDKTLTEDEGFTIYAGYSRGPDPIENQPKTAVSSQHESTSIGLPEKPLTQRSFEKTPIHREGKEYPYPDGWKEPKPAGNSISDETTSRRGFNSLR